MLRVNRHFCECSSLFWQIDLDTENTGIVFDGSHGMCSY